MMLENYLRHCKDNLSCYHHVLVHNHRCLNKKTTSLKYGKFNDLLVFLRGFTATMTATTGDGTHL